MALLSNKELAAGLKVVRATTVGRARPLAIPRRKDDWRARSFFFRHKSTQSNGEYQLKRTGDLCDTHALSGSCLLSSLLKRQSEGTALSPGIASLFPSLPSVFRYCLDHHGRPHDHGRSGTKRDQSLQSGKEDGGGCVPLERDLLVTLSWWLKMLVLCLTILKRGPRLALLPPPKLGRASQRQGEATVESSRCKAQGLSGLPGSCLSHAPLKPNGRHPELPALRSTRGGRRPAGDSIFELYLLL